MASMPPPPALPPPPRPSSSASASGIATPVLLPVTTRSRTLLFFSYRDSAARPRRPRQRTPRYDLDDDDDLHDSDERQGLMRGAAAARPAASSSSALGHVAIDVHELPPKWVDISDQVEDILNNVQPKIAALDKLHAKHVLPGFTDRSGEERDIEAATSEITRDFRQCHSLIQRIAPTPAAGTHTFPPKQATQQETLAAKNVQRALAAKVQELSGTFRKKQRVYMERLQGHAIKNQDVLVASGVVRLRGLEGMSALEEDVRATSTLVGSASSSDQTLIQSEDTDVRQRTHEVNEIAKSIGQLAELFKDLSSMVIDQGTILDSVEWNVQQASVEVEEAVKELNVAQRYQKNTGRRQCIFLLIIVIIGLILVLIFKPKRHSAPPPSPAPAPAPSTSLSSSGS